MVRQSDDVEARLLKAEPERIGKAVDAAIQKALEENRWNRTRTAAQLGITFRALRYKLKKLGMD